MNQTHNDLNEETLLKIIVIGGPKVGKTSFVKRYECGVFDELQTYAPTIGGVLFKV